MVAFWRLVPFELLLPVVAVVVVVVVVVELELEQLIYFCSLDRKRKF